MLISFFKSAVGSEVVLIYPGGNQLFKCFKFDPPLYCENLIFQIVKLAVNSLDNAFFM